MKVSIYALKILCGLCFLCCSKNTQYTKIQTLASPNKQLTVQIEIQDFESGKNRLVYRVLFNDQAIITDSPLAFSFRNAKPFRGNFATEKISRTRHDETWKPVYGEQSQIRDDYNQLTLELTETVDRRKVNLIVRAYDAGIAFCYYFPEQEGMNAGFISREETEFRFLADHDCWVAYRAQAPYEKVKLSQINPGCERPLVIQINDSLYTALAEARLVDYARMKFAPHSATKYTLISHLDSAVQFTTPFKSPWRVIMLAENPAQLLQNNYLILNLNDPCEIKDVAWIQPGKIIREISLTTAGGMACVDFAVKNNFKYIHFDAGWYGHEYHDSSDATTVSVDPQRSKGPLDLHRVIQSAESKGIGVWLYVNRRALEKQLDTILPLYQSWGIKGVKYGFVQVGSQKWTSWLHQAIQKAADHQLMVDVHDEYRPTGYSRTYPNFLTQEGIRGDEERQSASTQLVTLFTRMIAGAGDNTVCYYNPRVDQYWSHGFQLAKAVCFYSPLQFLYWYDRPPVDSNEVVTGSIIGDEPELEFFKAVPTVWHETRILDGEIGEYAIIARRFDEQWFIGCMNANQPRTFELPLSFLPAGIPFRAQIYADDDKIKTRTQVRVSFKEVNRNVNLTVKLGAPGGVAIHVIPLNN